MSAAAPFSAAEFLKGLTDEQKEEVLHAIVAEVLALYPTSGVIALHPQGGELMAHILTPAGRKQLLDGDGWRWLPEILIPVVHDEGELPKGLTVEELCARLGWAVEGPAREQTLRATG